ncbi:hypothetical protein Ae406Ps2_3023c [Pseudonocardia sp. Ae406_Ps2]|nr:hypothetical protein Ae331Ps2_2906 [Pseudonocardia sp. Ae331_Ps2]OLM03023.1 hypothetical protein Ae406Ps2_3023c [Pseudonocardia sp. Ae406_Ps2]
MAQLSDDGRRAVRRYWDEVTREVWGSLAVQASPGASEYGIACRERREARRAIARVALSTVGRRSALGRVGTAGAVLGGEAA